MRKPAEVTSRRDVIKTCLSVLTATGLATEAFAAEAARPDRLAQQAEKLAQDVVQYQKTPKEGAKCSLCVNFVKPDSCKIVAGTISPDGWCVAFAPSTG